MVEFIQTHETTFWWLTATSIITFLTTLIVVPWLVVRMPPDYFSNTEHRRVPWSQLNPIVRGVLLVGKNTLGYIFIVLGVLMLVLPGQGMLTIMIGIMLIDFPGKYRFERWMVIRRPVLYSINWFRQKAKQSPIVLDVKETG